MTGVAFYRSEAGLYQPLDPAAAPGTRRRQSDGSVGGLLTREIERTPAPAPMRIARVTIELSSPAPFAPSEVRARIVREGKRQQLVEAELLVDGEVCASAIGLRVAESETPREAFRPHGFPAPEDAPRRPPTSVLDEGAPMQIHTVLGARGQAGPGAYWTTFNTDLVAGEPASPTVRAVMACAMAATVASGAGRNWSCSGIDLSLYFARPPAGDRILTEADAGQYAEGFGLVSSTLSDAEGPFGYGRQTLLYAHAQLPSP